MNRALGDQQEAIAAAPARRVDLLRWAPPVAVGIGILLAPLPTGIDARGHALLAIFGGLIVALVTAPLPLGAVAMIALVLAMVSGTIAPEQAFAAFGVPVIWLIVVALVIARSLSTTGLSRRIALQCVRLGGSSPLRMAYALALADLLFAPFIPSDTARAGGIVLPIARSLAEENGSLPGETAGRLGRFLIQSAYHVGVTTAAMFLTSMAANPLIAELAARQTGLELSWGTWAIAGIVPGLTAIALIPWVLFRLDPPQLGSEQIAPDWARRQLKALGRVTAPEKWQVLVLLFLIAGWISQPLHGLPPAVVALCGLAAALLVGAISWDDMLGERGAWDALIWFGIVLMLAKALNDAGVVAALVLPITAAFKLNWWLAAILLLVPAYLYVHYLYASMTAQITTLYPAFVALALGSGTPPLVAVLVFAFFSSLNACLTHYGSGSSPVLFGAGYVSQTTWWRNGFAIALVQLVVWLGIGLAWWRLIGLY